MAQSSIFSDPHEAALATCEHRNPVNIALYGGTFDPVHKGHLEVARAAADALGLDRVLFIPVGVPPHRGRRPGASYIDRHRMIEIACKGDARFEASDLEAARADGRPNYSIDTIHTVKEGLTAGDRLFFVIGCDAFADIRTWLRWEEVVREVEWIVVSRPGSECSEDTVPEGARVYWLRDVAVPISSTELRKKLGAGEDVADSLPGEVAQYIEDCGLYRPSGN